MGICGSGQSGRALLRIRLDKMTPDLQALYTKLQSEHYSRPQDLMRIEVAMRSVDEALAHLAALGHQMHLEPGAGTAPGGEASFPRLMFHVHAAPNGRLVRSRWELADLEAGAKGTWFDTLASAQHAEGTRAQFAGRGGVGARNLPVVIPMKEQKK